jgi:CxxC motif-containing protein (DUF1111 family)
VLAASTAAKRGKTYFTNAGCDTCHHPEFTTADTGTPMANGDLVPEALGHKKIHPYSDFLLHNIGTSDRIAQEGMPQNTRHKMRTAPLWGLRTHQVFLHDGSAPTIEDAIQRHAVEAAESVQGLSGFNSLSSIQQQDLITFLMSL